MDQSEREMLRLAAANWLKSEDGYNYVFTSMLEYGGNGNLRERLNTLAEKGRLEMAFVWMANMGFTMGGDWAGAALLVAGGEGTDDSEARTTAFVKDAFEEKFQSKKGQKEVEKLIADDAFRPYRVRQIPQGETPGGPVYFFDVLLTEDTGKSSDGSPLPLVPCLVAPELDLPIIPIPKQIYLAVTKGLESTAVASAPGLITASDERILEVSERTRLDVKNTEAGLDFVRMQLIHGDSRAAMVINLDPLIVAAYTDEIDCVALLEFPSPPNLVERHNLEVGSRLLSVNRYENEKMMGEDLFPGPANTQRWKNFGPIIAEFVSKDFDRINERKQKISEEEWKKCWEMGLSYWQEHPSWAREGDPTFSNYPSAGKIEAMKETAKSDVNSWLLGCVVKTVVIVGLVFLIPFVLFEVLDIGDDPAKEKASSSSTPPGETEVVRTKLPSQNCGNTELGISIADLAGRELNIILEDEPNFVVGVEEADQVLNAVVRAVRDIDEVRWLEESNAAIRRAAKLKQLPKSTMINVALFEPGKSVGYLRGKLGADADLLERKLGMELHSDLYKIVREVDGYKTRKDLRQEEQEWVDNWLPVRAEAGVDSFLAYPPEPGVIWRTWIAKSGQRVRGKFVHRMPTSVVVWRGPQDYFPVNLEALTDECIEIAEKLTLKQDAGDGTATAIPELDLNAVEGNVDGSKTGGPIENRAKREWDFGDFGKVTGRLLAMGSKDQHRAILIIEETGKVNVMPFSKLDQESIDYVERVRTAEIHSSQAPREGKSGIGIFRTMARSMKILGMAKVRPSGPGSAKQGNTFDCKPPSWAAAPESIDRQHRPRFLQRARMAELSAFRNDTVRLRFLWRATPLPSSWRLQNEFGRELPQHAPLLHPNKVRIQSRREPGN